MPVEGTEWGLEIYPFHPPGWTPSCSEPPADWNTSALHSRVRWACDRVPAPSSGWGTFEVTWVRFCKIEIIVSTLLGCHGNQRSPLKSVFLEHLLSTPNAVTEALPSPPKRSSDVHGFIGQGGHSVHWGHQAGRFKERLARCWCTGSVAPASGPRAEGLPGGEHTSLPLPSSHTLEREAMVPM